VMPVSFEIAETGEHVHDRIEIIDPEGQSHIVLVKSQVSVFELAGKINAGGGNIESGDIETLCCKIPAVTSFSASEIENAGIRGQIKRPQQVVEGILCFLFVVTFVQRVVIRRIEPLFEPFLFHGDFCYVGRKVHTGGSKKTARPKRTGLPGFMFEASGVALNGF